MIKTGSELMPWKFVNITMFLAVVFCSIIFELPAGAAPKKVPSSVETRADGTKIVKAPNGSTTEIHPDGSKIVTRADGSRIEVHADGSKSFTGADGSSSEIRTDGSAVGHTKNGVRFERKNGDVHQVYEKR